VQLAQRHLLRLQAASDVLVPLDGGPPLGLQQGGLPPVQACSCSRTLLLLLQPPALPLCIRHLLTQLPCLGCRGINRKLSRLQPAVLAGCCCEGCLSCCVLHTQVLSLPLQRLQHGLSIKQRAAGSAAGHVLQVSSLCCCQLCLRLCQLGPERGKGKLCLVLLPPCIGQLAPRLLCTLSLPGQLQPNALQLVQATLCTCQLASSRLLLLLQLSQLSCHLVRQ
jgi:hypothetical protein